MKNLLSFQAAMHSRT